MAEPTAETRGRGDAGARRRGEPAKHGCENIAAASSPLRAPLSIAALGAAFFALYVATLTRFYTFDSIAYADNIRMYERWGTNGWLFHPHHLGFNSMGLLTHRLLQVFHPSTLSITGLQVFTAFMGAMGVAAFAAWMVEATGSLWASLTGATALGGSYGWWFASTDGRANIASAAMLLLVLWALGRAKRHSSARWCGVAGLFLGMTVLLHESHVFFLPVAIIAAWLTDGTRPRRLRRVAVLVIAFFATVGIPYAIVVFGVLGLHSPSAVRHWLLSYGEQGTWWNFHVWDNLPKDAAALYEIFTGQDLVKGKTGWTAGGNLGKHFVVLWILLWIFTLSGVVEGVWKRARATLFAPLLALLLYSSFFTIWTPGYFVFWLTQAAVLVALLAVGWVWGAKITFQKVVITLIVVTLGAESYVNAIRPKTRAAHNPYLQTALQLKPLAGMNNLMILSGMGWKAQSEVYVPYFADIPVVALHAAWDHNGKDVNRATAAIRAAIDHSLALNGRVYLLGEAVESRSALSAMQTRYGVTPQQIKDIFSPYTLTVVERVNNVNVYRLLRRGLVHDRAVNDPASGPSANRPHGRDKDSRRTL